MRKLLSTFTFILLSKFTHFSYATPDTFGLNDFPDEIKLHIGLQLSIDNQKNLSIINKSFNAIMADDKIMEHNLGLNLNRIDSFGKQLFKDAKQGNFNIVISNTHKGSLDPMIYIDRACQMTYHSFDNDGHIDFVQSTLPLMANQQDGNRFLFYGSNLDGSLLAGSCLNLILRDVNEKLQDIAVKYTSAIGEFIYLFPIDSEFESYATGLNTNGNIIVGEINPQEETYGFICNDDEDAIFLKNLQQSTSNHPQAVSDNGEVIVGYVVKNDKEHAAIWLHDASDNAYHPCLLQDLIMHNCSAQQRKLLQDKNCTYFDRVLAVSPDGKAMFVKTSNPNTSSPYDRNNIHDIKIIFGKSIISQAKDKIFVCE